MKLEIGHYWNLTEWRPRYNSIINSMRYPLQTPNNSNIFNMSELVIYNLYNFSFLFPWSLDLNVRLFLALIEVYLPPQDGYGIFLKKKINKIYYHTYCILIMTLHQKQNCSTPWYTSMIIHFLNHILHLIYNTSHFTQYVSKAWYLCLQLMHYWSLSIFFWKFDISSSFIHVLVPLDC